MNGESFRGDNRGVSLSGERRLGGESLGSVSLTTATREEEKGESLRDGNGDNLGVNLGVILGVSLGVGLGDGTGDTSWDQL